MDVGALLVVGFDGLALPPSLKKDLAQGSRGGVILFRRNCDNVEQVHALCREVAGAVPGDAESPIISVDQEGGRVARLGAPCIKIPTARALGKASLELTQRAAEAQNRELRALGFTLNFAPVLDIHTNDANPVIGDRAFGITPESVSAYAGAYIRGARAAGMLTCGKHFPGHGNTSQDSHLTLPRLDETKELIHSREVAPFRAAVELGVDSMMSAHVVYTELDASQPATLSRAIATTLLRETLSFSGVLFSDDLEMKALSDDTGENALRAILAGCDMLLVCATEARHEAAYEALVHEYERSTAFRARADEALGRARAMRARAPSAPSFERFRELVRMHQPLAKELAAL